MEPLRLNGAKVLGTPFPHLVAPQCIEEDTASALLGWFESEALWRPLSEDGFYNFYGLNLHITPPPDSLRFLVNEEFLAATKRQIEILLGARVGDSISVAAQKLLPGCKIGIHTDYEPQGLTHRLVIQFNRGWNPQNGGILMLFDKEEPDEDSTQHRYYVPHHRMGIGFTIFERSFHAVSPVYAGDRYTLCISFAEKRAAGAGTTR